MKNKIIVLVIILILLSCTHIYATEDIMLDGKYNDWDDKPYYDDPIESTSPAWHISKVSWYPDNVDKRLYIYCNREKNLISVWSFTIHFNTDTGLKIANVIYDTNDETLKVLLYDGRFGEYLWSVTGKWTSNGKELEFYIPIDYLVSSIESGYKVDMYFSNYFDRLPNDGKISVSTISTFPFYTSVCGFVLVITSMVLRKRKHRV